MLIILLVASTFIGVMCLYFVILVIGSFEEDTALPKGLENWNKEKDGVPPTSATNESGQKTA